MWSRHNPGLDSDLQSFPRFDFLKGMRMAPVELDVVFRVCQSIRTTVSLDNMIRKNVRDTCCSMSWEHDSESCSGCVLLGGLEPVPLTSVRCNVDRDVERNAFAKTPDDVKFREPQ
jgi:hypothetical protein